MWMGWLPDRRGSELSAIPRGLGTDLGTKRGATAEMAWNAA